MAALAAASICAEIRLRAGLTWSKKWGSTRVYQTFWYPRANWALGFCLIYNFACRGAHRGRGVRVGAQVTALCRHNSTSRWGPQKALCPGLGTEPNPVSGGSYGPGRSQRPGQRPGAKQRPKNQRIRAPIEGKIQHSHIRRFGPTSCHALAGYRAQPGLWVCPRPDRTPKARKRPRVPHRHKEPAPWGPVPSKS